MNDQLYVKNLEAVIKQIIKPLKKVPFNLVVESVYDKKVLPFDAEARENKDVLKKLIKAIKDAGNSINKSGGIISKRPNEVGNKIESFVKESLAKVGYEVTLQTTKTGKNKSSGYPDMQFKDGLGRVFYLECKTFNIKNTSTTQRSFYLSPSQDPKVNHDGFHFVVSFEVTKNTEEKGYKCASYKLLSIEKLLCDLKHEFNSDNKRLYSKELIIAEGNF